MKNFSKKLVIGIFALALSFPILATDSQANMDDYTVLERHGGGGGGGHGGGGMRGGNGGSFKGGSMKGIHRGTPAKAGVMAPAIMAISKIRMDNMDSQEILETETARIIVNS